MEGAYFNFDACKYLDLLFFCSCRYRTIADRLLCMSLVPSRRLVKRDVSYEFMNRQMVWHAFTVSYLAILTPNR
jgi:peroxin-2